MDLQPIEIPKQERSRRALERLVETGEALLAAHRFESTGVAEIARMAGSSVGTFYRLIGDRDRLLCIVHDRFLEHGHALITERLDPARFEGAPLHRVLRGFVALLVEVYAAKEGLLRALIIRSSAEPSFRERVHALNDHLGVALAALVQPRLDQIGHPDPESAIVFGAKVVLGALNHHTLVRSLELQNPSALVEELGRVLVRYLDVTEAPA
ncbi:TetR/AcrR family transcriptional regulator [Paraliomyxa miuraensis]|uniref:TetR/AcrR family transcriptional regulator n=1 Tax=Paraliomyxa miuraensis TaxID=376150 RepID=UPI00224ED92D|nr:TetR/AcrR family transcriptional regulator [Paraliomyxa miuraensis]MCX4244031.1 TetR/AcrR family transcriptional regulator [Paraliomyxa miuraensis]